MNKNSYEQRGVFSDKEDVHAVIQNIDKGIFPQAFCKIIPDMLGGDENYCNVVHADGVDTKTSLAYLYWKETGDMSVWKGVVQDSIVMNLDDLICIGATKVPLLLSGTIGRNKHLIPGKVIATIINGAKEFCEEMRKLGINIYTISGKTTDLDDLVRTIVIDNTLTCRIHRNDVILTRIRPGNLIVGLASFGQATYEKEYNSGMGSNGLTSSWHEIFCRNYIKKYPEIFHPKTDKKHIYCGQYKVNHMIPKEHFREHAYKAPKDIKKLVLSPTRTYAPIIKEILENIHSINLDGIIHCSDGGQTKVMKFVDNVHIIKDNLFPMPPLFEMIREYGGYYAEKRKEMYQSFNMGHRMELYVNSEQTAQQIIEIAKSFNVEAKVIGHVEAYEGKRLTIKDGWYEFVW